MAFTLTYLGTDTQYTPNGYCGGSRGETLSYISSRISKPLDITSDEEDVVYSDNPSVEDSIQLDSTGRLHNGPDTLGYKFYDIMAKGVSDALRTIAYGEQTINIMGHSRGAVESIIASHELDRIQSTLQDAGINSADDLLDLLCNSEHEQTKLCLKQYLEPHKERLSENLHVLKDKMAQVKVNLFLLDPVPGGRVFGISAAKIVDDRYFNIPPIVNFCHEILLENERSRGFKAIVPRVTEPQKTTFSLMNLPGHHGTASGNPYDQQKSQTSEILMFIKRREVQDITLYELYDFLTKHGVEFNDDEINGGENDLDKLFLSYHRADLQTRSNIKLDTYAIILKNKAAYTTLNQTCYATGQEGSVQRTVTLGLLDLSHDRLIHVGGPGDTSLKSIVSFQSDAFVNAAHARLFLRKELGLTEDQTAVDSLNAILDNFDAKMKIIHDIFSHDRTGELTQTIKSSLQMMFSGLVQAYLRNNLSEIAKNDILAVIQRAISIKLQTDSLAGLIDLVNQLKLYLVENLSEDLHALIVSHQQDVLNLLSCDERNIQIIEDKIRQLEQFKLHLEVLNYFTAFESVQSQLTASQKILDESLISLATRRDALIKNRHYLLILSGFHDRALSSQQASMQAENEQLQARIEVIQHENTRIYAEFQEQQCAYEALQVEKARVDTVLEAQIRDNSALSGERDALRTERDTQAQRAADLEGLLARPASDCLFHGLSLEILGTFALVLGSAVVALSLAALMLTPVAPIVPLGIGLAGAGLATAGFFGMKQGVQEQHQEALYHRSLN